MIKKADIDKGLKEYQYWDLGNKILYDLCKKYPKHTEVDEIFAKIWLIGRSYSVAIERRKSNRDISNDEFYKKVCNTIKQNKIDKKLDKLKSLSKYNEETIKIILEVYEDINKIFKELTGINKTSLISKYLHFHFPEIVPIYDSRAKKSISILISKNDDFKKKDSKNTKKGEYERFCYKILWILEEMRKTSKKNISLRDLDKYLLYIYEK